MSKRDVLGDFLARAEESFEFLTEANGFLGPEHRPDGLAYHSQTLEIDVLFDRREQVIVTLVRAMVEELRLRAELSCLYAEATLGPVQDVIP